MKKECNQQSAIQRAWEDYVIKGVPVKAGIVRREILESWRRSKALGINPNTKKIPYVLNKEQLSVLLAKNRLLIGCAKDILGYLFDLIIEDASADNAIMLMDHHGYLLEVMGVGPTWNKFTIEKKGTCFHEEYMGTTAAALTLRHDRPFEVSASEFYLKLFHVSRVFSVPLHDEQGKIIGVLELAVEEKTKLRSSHSLALVVAMAGMLEKQLYLMQAIEQKNFFSGSLVASMASLEEGMIVLGADSKIIHINPFVEKMLNVKLNDVRNLQLGRVIKHPLIADAVNGKIVLLDHEIILDEAAQRKRYFVSANHVLNSAGERIGLTFIFKEFKSVQTLVQRVAGLQAHYTFNEILGESPELQNVVRIAKVVSKNTSNVLIVGESGTGKELVAQSIHNASIGTGGPFVGINCAAFPPELIESELFGYEPGTFTGGLRQGKPGKLELANGGTLFLDEVNGMSLDMQVKLLRVLEEKKFQRLGGTRYIKLDARIISATNQDLRERISLGYFRSDLYYRLAVIEIQIPPLRLHRQDINVFVDCFVQEMNRKLGRSIRGCSHEAMEYLMSYSWPGNVRELKNWIERAASLSESDILSPNDFPSPMNAAVNLRSHEPAMNSHNESGLSGTMESIERDRIKQVLKKCGGNTELAARQLAISRATLYRKIKKYGMVSKEIH